MSFSTDIDKFLYNTSKQLDHVKDQALDDGLNIAKQLTPVKSGYLQNEWKIDDDSIYNDVYYGIYVNNGTEKQDGHFMVEITNEKLKNNINNGKYNK